MPNSSSVVIVVPGAYGNDVDGDYPSLAFRPHFYADIAAIAAKAGVASVRYARLRDDWQNVPLLRDETVDETLGDRVNDLERAIDLARSALKPRRILLVAHSDGCIVASEIRDPIVGGMLGVSCPKVRLFDLFVQRVVSYQGAASKAAQQLREDVASVRAGRTPNDPRDAVAAYFFGPHSAGPLPLLEQIDRVDPCDTYVGVSFPLLLVSGRSDELAIGACGPGVQQSFVQGNHYMQVSGRSQLPWVSAQPELSSEFGTTLTAWIGASNAAVIDK